MATKGPKTGTPTKSVAPAVKADVIAAEVASPAPKTAKVAKPAVRKAAKPAVVVPEVVAAPAAAAPATIADVTPVAPTVAAAPVIETPAPETVVAPAPVAPVVAPDITPAVAAAPAAKTPTPASKKANIMENTLHAATEKTQALFVDMNERTKAAVEKSTQLFADMNELSKGNVDALVESSKIAVKGIETMGQEAADYTRKSFEGATAAMRDLASVKTPADFMKLQSDFVRTAFDNLVAETSKNTEAMLKLAGDIAQPISNRVAVAAEKIKVGA
ncbi:MULTISPECIES: phasin family protein [Sphingomonas]|uniref:phasin family protein n=1 Tax=Sphingomonas TaxID=13687 RepID=UPI00082C8C6C|nr:phasin family protein [Sphingomonas sp. CCH10-B3]